MKLESIALKLASLGLATLLWFVIAREKTSEIGVQVPLELQNFPRQLELTGEPVNTVEVRLRASPGVIEQLTPADISAAVDVTGAAEGERIVHVTPESIRVPFGVQVVKITPSSLTLDFERTVQKSVPVRPRLLGQPADGFEVAEVHSEPAEIVIVGPRSRVADVESAFTEPLGLDAAAADISADLVIGLDDPVLRVLGTPRARVTALVRERTLERPVEGVEVEMQGAAAGSPPRVVTVVLAGPATAVRAVPSSEIKARADASGASPSGSLVPVTVEIAPGHAGVTVQRVEPAEIRLRPAPRRRS